jgi:hypothetical protein
MLWFATTQSKALLASLSLCFAHRRDRYQRRRAQQTLLAEVRPQGVADFRSSRERFYGEATERCVGVEREAGEHQSDLAARPRRVAV